MLRKKQTSPELRGVERLVASITKGGRVYDNVSASLEGYTIMLVCQNWLLMERQQSVIEL